ncbi:MAG: hypothetical protein M3220_19460 [Chloroflexota bacterium]|nr:hypothetical protein [Chloroflexota bacterium]
MRYLYRPSEVETLMVRGRYDFVNGDGEVWASEVWERYQNDGSPVQTWRSEWTGEREGQRFALVSHSVVSPEGLERVKLRLILPDYPQQNLSVTTMPDSVLVNDDGDYDERALPAGYGIFAPQPSLARFAFPFDLASEERELGIVFFVRLRLQGGRLHGRPTKFDYTPLGLRDFEVRAKSVRGKGWRMEVPGLPRQEGWFDRNGTCLHWVVDDGKRSWEAQLADWLTFG